MKFTTKRGRKLQNTKTFYIKNMLSKKIRKEYDVKIVNNEKVILTKKGKNEK